MVKQFTLRHRKFKKSRRNRYKVKKTMKGSGKYFDRLRNYLSNINIRSWYPSWMWKKTAKTKTETAPHNAHSRPKHEEQKPEARSELKEENLKHIEKNTEPNISASEDIEVLPKPILFNIPHVNTLSQKNFDLNIILSQYDESDNMYIEVNPSDKISTLHKAIEDIFKGMYIEKKKSQHQEHIFYGLQKPIKAKIGHRLILYFNDEELDNDKTIAHYNLKQNSKIYAIKQITSPYWG